MPLADFQLQSRPSAWHRVRLIAGETYVAALHLRLTVLLGLAAGALVLMSGWLREFNFGTMELKFLVDFGLGAMGFGGILLAALATAHLYFGEFEDGAISCVLSRPVRRWEFIAGKLIGVMALLALFVVVLSFVLALVIVWRERQLGTTFLSWAEFLQACSLVWLKITLVAGMTLLICSYASSALFATCSGLFLAVIAQLRPFTSAEGPMTFLRLWPNLSLFDVAPMLAGEGLTLIRLLAIAGYWAVFMFLFGVLTAYVFKHREF